MKLQRLIENLLSFSAWQAKSVGLEVSEFKLRPLIKSVLENQQLTLVAQRVRLDVQVEDLMPLADRGKIRLILDNLLSNAIKFTPRGGTISIHARSEREQLVLDVMDSGPGIPVEERNRIFEAFYQGKTPQGAMSKAPGSAFPWSPSSSMPTAAASKSSRRRPAARISACASPCAIQRPCNVKRLMRLKPGRAALCALTLCALCSCAAMAVRPAPRRRRRPNPSTARVGADHPLLDLMSALPKGDPARQAELFQSAKDAASLSPTTSNRLKYALALAIPATAAPIPSPHSDSCRNCWSGLRLCYRMSAFWRWWSCKRSISDWFCRPRISGCGTRSSTTPRISCRRPIAGCRPNRTRTPSAQGAGRGACEARRGDAYRASINDRGTSEPPHTPDEPRRCHRRDASERLFNCLHHPPVVRAAARHARQRLHPETQGADPRGGR